MWSSFLGAEQGSARSLAFFMLDKVPAPEVIPETVENSVRPYALEQQIPLDQLLLHYIKVSAWEPGGEGGGRMDGASGDTRAKQTALFSIVHACRAILNSILNAS